MNRRILSTILIIFTAGTWTAIAKSTASPVQTTTGESHKLERGGQVSIRGFTGRVVIRGSDQETIQAVGKKGGETVPVRILAESPNVLSIEPSPGSARGEDLELEVTLPSFAGLKSVETHGDIEVHDVQGAVRLRTTSGNIRVFKTGPLNAATNSGEIDVHGISEKAILANNSGNIEVEGAGSVDANAKSGDIKVSGVAGSVTAKTNSGDLSAKDVQGDLLVKSLSGGIMASNIKGLVNASNSSETIRIQNTGGDVHAVSISGDVHLECVKGRAETNTVSSSIHLENVGGDIDATTTSGDVSFQGKLRPGGRYRLKSFSGTTRMELADPIPGFTATLSAYSGEIETDFALRVETTEQQGSANRRIIGRYEDGQTQVNLDSFSGPVQLKKGGKDKTGTCK